MHQQHPIGTDLSWMLERIHPICTTGKEMEKKKTTTKKKTKKEERYSEE